MDFRNYLAPAPEKREFQRKLGKNARKLTFWTSLKYLRVLVAILHPNLHLCLSVQMTFVWVWKAKNPKTGLANAIS
jgi:hypothetical protein